MYAYLLINSEISKQLVFNLVFRKLSHAIFILNLFNITFNIWVSYVPIKK